MDKAVIALKKRTVHSINFVFVLFSFAENVAGHYISPFHDIPLKVDLAEVLF